MVLYFAFCVVLLYRDGSLPRSVEARYFVLLIFDVPKLSGWRNAERDVEEMMSIEEEKYCNESNRIIVLLYCRMVLVTYVGKPKGEVGRDAVVVIGCCSYEVQEEARRERKKKSKNLKSSPAYIQLGT